MPCSAEDATDSATQMIDVARFVVDGSVRP